MKIMSLCCRPFGLFIIVAMAAACASPHSSDDETTTPAGDSASTQKPAAGEGVGAAAGSSSGTGGGVPKAGPTGSPSAAPTTPTATTTAPPPTTMTSPPNAPWTPAPGTSWQWQISGTVDTTVNASVYDIDMFDSAQATIDTLHASARKVVCYFDVAYEPNRPDSSKYTANAAVLGKVMDGWPDEKWVDIRSQVIRDIMTARMDIAAQKKCDGIEVDDIDVYANDSGFPITAADNIDFAKTMATEAHKRGLSIALKNDVDQVNDLVADFDFAVNEECFKYDECDTLKPFIDAGKAVFQVEYGDQSTATTICPKANAANFDSLVKKLDLGAWRISCR